MRDAVRGSIEPMHSEAIPPRDSTERVSEVLNRVMNQQTARHMGANQRAAVAWSSCNGDRERAHTTRVFLRKPRVAGADPIICVYVDSHTYLTDLTANRDLYLSRLANWGFYVSGIEFAVDRDAQRHRVEAQQRQTASEVAASTAPQPSDELVQEVQNMVRDLPDSLKEGVFKAIIASKTANGKK